MEQERRNMRMGILVILCALMLQLASDALVQVFADPRVASFFVFMETGRWVRFEVPPPPETEPTTVATEPPRKAVSFDIQEAELVGISNFTHYEPDIGALLTSPLFWDLTEGGPAVLIVHTHATESYTGTPGYRTEDENHNMLRVGQEIKEILEENGIGVIHDTTLHDEPSYNNAYIYARETIEARLQEYPSIRVVLDIHRDALELSDAVQLSTSATVDGENSAQLMLVMGTDAGNRYHPDWQGNLAVGVKLQVLLERNYPGICRRMQLRTERFNQDLAPGGMLVEVGAAGDTLEEALVAARAFARCLVELSQGTAD